jgi:hypothetical protein
MASPADGLALAEPASITERHDDHIGAFMAVVDDRMGTPEGAWILWWQDRLDLGDRRSTWSMALEIRETNPALFASFLAWRGHLQRRLELRSPGSVFVGDRILRAVHVSRHRRASGRKPIKRRGSRRRCAPTRGSPDDDPHEPDDPARGRRHHLDHVADLLRGEGWER